jgi:hypothetical protein
MQRGISVIRRLIVVLSMLMVVYVGGLGTLAVLSILARGYGAAEVGVVLVTAIYAFGFGQNIRTATKYSGTMRRWSDLAPLPIQPDPALALPPGERATFGFALAPGRIARMLAPRVVTTCISTLVIVLLLASFMPTIMPPWLRLGAALSLPVAAQWALLLAPVALSGYTLLSAIFSALRRTHITYVVDDAGITIRRLTGRTRRLAWGDITYVARTTVLTGDQRLGYFTLAGPRHLNDVLFLPTAEWTGLRGLRDITFTPPLPDYGMLADRIVATIIQRTGVPLRGVTGTYFRRPGSGVVTTFGMMAQDVAQCPLAETAWQPPADAHAAVDAAPYTLGVIASRLHAGTRGDLHAINATRIVPLHYSTLVFLLLLALGNFTPWLALVAVPVAAALFVVLRRTLPRRILRRQTIHITADAAGLHRREFGRMDIPWDRILAWGVILPTAKQPNVYYAIFWDGPTLVWIEPQQGRDPQHVANYRAKANRLHAIIFAHTSLPVRDLTAC